MSLILSFLSFVQMRSCSWTAVPCVLLTLPLTSNGSLPSFQVKLLFLFCVCLFCVVVWGLHFYLLYFVILAQFICCLSNCFLFSAIQVAFYVINYSYLLLYVFPTGTLTWWFCLTCLRKVEQTKSNKNEKSIYLL